MKISWNWLQKWVDLDGLDADALGHQLTMAGLELEGIERIGAGMDDIVVAKITSIEPHPNADRLVVCQVDDGSGAPRQIVCGAKNMGEGDVVPCALPGSQPPTFDFTIGERKMRGVLSQGMLCGGEEIGLDDGVDGLLILPESLGARVGEPVFEALGLKDVVLELSLTPNRPDALSHAGVAREVAALNARSVNDGATRTHAIGDAAPVSFDLSIDDADGCSSYAMAIVEGVQVGPSPEWLRDALQSIGVRSINNIVDVTNYVMMDIGQPLHVFDMERLEGPAIHVRRATAGETIEGIDHKTYTLTEADLVIADASSPVAIAGVMGGAGSEVSDSTTRVLLECACFQTTTVRKSAKRHALHTESSHRFERGVDPKATKANMLHALSVLLEVAGPDAEVKGWAIAKTDVADAEATQIVFPRAMSNEVLGTEATDAEIEAALQSIGFGVADAGEGAWTVTVPSWRPDVERTIDLVEEVARLIGFDNIPTTMPMRRMGYAHTPRAAEDAHPETILSAARIAAMRRTEDLLLSLGLHQAVNYSFMSQAELDELMLAEDDERRSVHHIANPLTQDHAYMRTSLVPGLLRNLRTNLSQRRHDVALFEIGRRYLPGREVTTAAMLLTGNMAHHWTGARAWDFYDLKGVVELLGRGASLGATRWVVSEEPYLHPGVQASWVTEEGAVLATIGQLHPALAQSEGWPAVFVAEVDLGALLGASVVQPAFKALSRYPESVRDYAFLLDASCSWGQIEESVAALRAKEATIDELLVKVELFDVYQGEQIPEGKRSLAMQATYRSHERTLKDDEVAAASSLLVEHLASTLGAVQR